MAKETKQDKGVRILITLGWKEVSCQSKKYRQLKNPDKENYYYFIGKRGAIRAGRSASNTISIGKVK